MFPFWDIVVSPVIRASGAERVVEIGALRGETTVQMLRDLTPDAEVHVIDPAPAFDPTEHERAFPGRYHFHRDLSHHVLPDLPAMDVALVDGDHNWYTVRHELRLLAEASAREGVPLPLLVLHDVDWPYGRRDLYYAPEQIPEEFRQPFERSGMLRGVSDLVGPVGVNPTMCNATHEGGPQNGVMTALEDFLDVHPEPVRMVVLPVYFGLAIVVEERRLATNPALVAELDRLESAAGQAAVARMVEEVRLDSMAMEQGMYFKVQTMQKAYAARYLDLLKGALLDEHHIENEVRIHQLINALDSGAPLDGESLRDPARQWSAQTNALLNSRRKGQLVEKDHGMASYFPYTTMGRTRLDRIQQLVSTIREETVKGDFVECGAGRGGGAIFLRGCAEAYEIPDRLIWIADQFRAAPVGTSSAAPLATGSAAGQLAGLPTLQADINAIRDGLARFDLLDYRSRFVQGAYDTSLRESEIQKVSLLHIGDSARDDAATILEELYDKVAVGGFVMIDRYYHAKCQAAVDEFRAQYGIDDALERVDFAAVCWRKTKERSRPGDGERSRPGDGERSRPGDGERSRGLEPGTGHVPLAPLARALEPKDLTVVVVFYNMKREAARTLFSLSRAYQTGLESASYEVIVVENGSDPDETLGAEYVQSFGPEFRYLDLGGSGHVSPVFALNEGVRVGAGDNFVLMIDGAHVLTPGVLRFGLAGLQTYAPAVVATQQWFVGPGEQGDMIAEGYNTEVEDRLFDSIQWPEDGYRLFDIGHFIGERDWLDGMWESNCVFATRDQLAQVGAFDEAFAMAGGGYANLDLYERLASGPEVRLVTMLGEGSFHQVHGGATTNLPDISDRHFKLGEYAAHFEELRGRPFRGPRKQLHYVGTMRPEAARTRPRRRTVPNPFKAGVPDGEGIPSAPLPLPRELRQEFVEAYWNTLSWQDTTWLGQAVPKAPTDLFAYQELLERVRPTHVVEIGSGNGGRAFFLATMFDLLGEGQVISIDKEPDDSRPAHPRITYIAGDSLDPAVIARVHKLVGEPPRALLVLGSRTSAYRTTHEFRAYQDLVPAGSYAVFEDTVVNGHPVWTEFGPGPSEAVRGVVEARSDFASDLSMGKYALSFNPGGFLKRVR